VPAIGGLYQLPLNPVEHITLPYDSRHLLVVYCFLSRFIRHLVRDCLVVRHRSLCQSYVLSLMLLLLFHPYHSSYLMIALFNIGLVRHHCKAPIHVVTISIL